MRIREAQVEDCAALRALFHEVDTFHAVARPELFRSPAPLRTLASIQAMLADPSNTVFVAERDGSLCGLALTISRSAPDLPMFVPRRFAIVETLAVAETARRQGVGRALMQHIQDWAIEQHLDELQLSVHEFNTGASAFYTELGYETVERKLRRRLAR